MIESPLKVLSCGTDERRGPLAGEPGLHGIDYLEVSPDQLELTVRFIPKAAGVGGLTVAQLVAALVADPSLIEIAGGVRMRGIEVVDVDPAAPGGEGLRIRVDRYGDFSTYTLILGHTAIDPAYSEVDFSFKAGCPSRFDCRRREICPPDERPEPPIDYMAKDYASFRQTLLDLIPTIVPDWTERHEADLGVALVELFAHAGDLLSYQQDAVANEAYLETARRRESVRRHARLVDYAMNDGASARAFVQVQLDGAGAIGRIAGGTQVLTRIETKIGPKLPPHSPVIVPSAPPKARVELEQARAGSAAIFETLAETPVAHVLNRIPIHPWGQVECCLPRGVTSLDLEGDLAFEDVAGRRDAWRLRRGSYLLLEEVLGSATGRPFDADPAHRQVVRLTEAVRLRDPVAKIDLTRVEWQPADALRFPLCLSARSPEGTLHSPVSVARGNLVLAEHGETRVEWHPADPDWGGPAGGIPEPGIEVGTRPYRLRLGEGPLARSVPTPLDQPGELQPVADMLASDPRLAVPAVSLRIGVTETDAQAWSPVPATLIDSGPFARHFAVETDDAGRATIRFGDGLHGMAPPEGSYVEATYRLGLGRAGNVGAEGLSHLIANPDPASPPLPPIAAVRNPLPAWGGNDPEPIAEVKRLAPEAFRALQLRAVTEADYAAVAQRHTDVQKAVATFRWTGSWHTVFLTIDPAGRVDVPETLRERLLRWMGRFAQAGYDLELQEPIYVPLELELDVCADRGHFRGDVELEVLEALGSRRLPLGGTGFFHPDRFTFGQPLFLSELYSAVEAIEGVESATVRRFSRQFDHDPAPARPVTAANIGQGKIDAGRLEVLRLDNDPSRPEDGVLRVRMGGGK